MVPDLHISEYQLRCVQRILGYLGSNFFMRVARENFLSFPGKLMAPNTYFLIFIQALREAVTSCVLRVGA